MESRLVLILVLTGYAVAAASRCTPGDKSAIPGSCKGYYECNDLGQRALKMCGFLKGFDPATKDCVLSTEINCDEDSPKCEHGKNYPHSDPGLYRTCFAGILKLQACPVLQVFDPETGVCRLDLRSLVGECVDAQRRPVDYDCRGYEVCEGGRWTKKTCSDSQHFSTAAMDCREGACSNCTHGDLSKGTACNRYMQCVRGLWKDMKCKEFHRFDPVKKDCVWYFEYDCPKNDTVPKCEDGEARSEDDCTLYSLCNGGKWSVNSCPEGHSFDASSLECKFSELASCDACYEDEPDMENCGAYYACVNGKKIRTPCGFMKEYDGVTKKCVFRNANCFPGKTCSTEGRKAAVDNCDKDYYVCKSGRIYKQSCSFSHIFNPQTSDCHITWPWKPSCNEAKSCSDGETKVLDCRRYVKCDGGKWSQEVCATGETFKDGKCTPGACIVKQESCTKYSINNVELECFQGQVFDNKRTRCVYGTCKNPKQ